MVNPSSFDYRMKLADKKCRAALIRFIGEPDSKALKAANEPAYDPDRPALTEFKPRIV